MASAPQAAGDGVYVEEEVAEAPWLDASVDAEEGWTDQPSEAPQRTVVGGFLILLALAWVAAVAWSAGQDLVGSPIAAPRLALWAAIASGPLALIGLAWLLFGRSSRLEAEKFIRAVSAMRAESESLSAVLASVEAQLAANRTSIAQGSSELAGLGEETAERLGAVNRDVEAGVGAMARYAEALDQAAGSARTDIGVLLADLPKAEAQARVLSETMRSAGLDAHEQASALEAQVVALAARARETDELSAGAAGRLTAHMQQMASAAGAAAGELETATAAVTAGVDGTLERAANAIDAARSGMEAQGQAMLAMIDQARAALDSAGIEAGRNLNARIDEIAAKVERLAGALAAQDAASHGLLDSIGRGIGETELRFVALHEGSDARSEQLRRSIGELNALAANFSQTLEHGDQWAGSAERRSQEMRDRLTELADLLEQRLPTAFRGVAGEAGRALEVAEQMSPPLEAAGAAAALTLKTLQESREALETQSQAAQSTLEAIEAALVGSDQRVAMLATNIGEAGLEAERLSQGAGQQLIETMVRVRETGNQAAERARVAIADVIPESAAALGSAAEAAMRGAVAVGVQAQLAELAAASEQAVEAARHASERLTRQMLSIGEMTAAVEGRIVEAQAAMRENEGEHFSRAVALLIESLNSTAIDVTKILSNEVTDSAWAAYLKGDRGVFTRRAVKLIDSGEAREIARHYEEEPEFREQVNRYIHDFEAMLRRVLAERDGSPLGVTLLSSDMGKLYVALAQAIERLRG